MGTAAAGSSAATVVRYTMMTWGLTINRIWILVSKDRGRGNDSCSSMVMAIVA